MDRIKIDEAPSKDKIETAKEFIIHLIEHSIRSITPRHLYKELAEKCAFDKKIVSKAIDALVREKSISYTYRFGCSFLEPSFNKVVHATDKIILKPSNMAYSSKSGEIVINLESGIAFGNGEHPTTRIALRGIAYAFDNRMVTCENRSKMLDIGTGSGILAITGLLMGIRNAIAVDTDPIAREEAKNNVLKNSLLDRITITKSIDEIGVGRFQVISANLRTPTLKSIKNFIVDHLAEEGVIVMSGIKEEEISSIIKYYESDTVSCIRKEVEKEWAGLVFQNCG